MLIKVEKEQDIPKKFISTPVGDLLRYQNLGKSDKKYDKKQLLIGMCMDYRKKLYIPENFAYILRTGGGNLRYNEFQVSYAIAVGGIKYIVLLAHDHCGMVNLISQKEKFVDGLCKNAGWDRKRAEEHFMNYAPIYEIDNEIDFVISEEKRLSSKYQGIEVISMFYNLEDNLLYLIDRD